MPFNARQRILTGLLGGRSGQPTQKKTQDSQYANSSHRGETVPVPHAQVGPEAHKIHLLLLNLVEMNV